MYLVNLEPFIMLARLGVLVEGTNPLRKMDIHSEAMVSHNLGPDGYSTMSSCAELEAPGSSTSSCSMPVGGEEAPASDPGELVG